MTRLTILCSLTVVALGAAPPSLDAGQTTQTGTLSGFGPPATQPLVLDAFDDQGGSLQLTSVTIEALTAIGGGYTTDGSGISVDVDAFLTADYSLAGTLLVGTQAVIDLTVPNTGPPIAVSVFDSDLQQAIITDPAALAAWSGGGTVTLDVFTEFSVVENPPGVIFFGAGGTVEYTVTYEYEPAPPQDLFLRGDPNLDGQFNIADAVFLLDQLFSGGTPTACPDSGDVNDDGLLNIADAISALDALFTGGGDPPPPFDSCGPDPTDDGLDCPTFDGC